MNKNLKIAVAGTGYVGLSIATPSFATPRGLGRGYHPGKGGPHQPPQVADPG